MPLARTVTLLRRAILLHCPHCGGRDLFSSWAILQYGGTILMVLAPIALYPFTKTVFLAVDLAVRGQS